MFKARMLSVLAGLVLIVSSVNAAEVADLGRVVVTPYRYGEDLDRVSSSVTVITAKDIKDSNATRVIDMLRPLSGITVRDYYGNGSNAVVDMAGFGEQAPLNVLVLVDGRRVNDIDLSGVDWTQIPLDMVERIEVVRGGSGAVLYGDNASSGVINIITKKGSGDAVVGVAAQYGSYLMNAQKVSVAGGVGDKLSYSFNGGRDSTEGYRHNSFSRSNDFAGKLAYALTDVLSLHIDSGTHLSTYGIPGALFQGNIDQDGRRFSRFGRDHANNKDYYVVVGAGLGLMEMGVLDMDFSYRRKDTDSYFLTSTNPTRMNKIETYGLTPKYTLNKAVLEHDNRFIAGADLYRSLYNSDNYNYSSNAFQNYTNINKTSIAGYLQDEFSITDKLVLVNGYRHESVRYAFNYFDQTGANPAQDTNIHPSLEAYNSGLAYNYGKDSAVFVNTGRSFRTPETDEFAFFDSLFQQQLDTTLKPQTSTNYQLGIRHQFSDNLKAGLAFFRMNVKDELYVNYLFDNNGSRNENYDKTVHQGLESSLEARLTDRISSFANYTYTDAHFNGGQYGGNEIPQAPRHKTAAGAKILLASCLTWNLTESYIGNSYPLNDQANAHSRVRGYALTDTSLSLDGKDWKTTFGINNLFGKKYSEVTGYDRWTDSRFYYPSPERNFDLRVEHRF